MSQSKFDPWLFIGEMVNYLLFWSKDEVIHDLAVLFCQSGIDLEQKDDAVGFLGVKIE